MARRPGATQHLPDAGPELCITCGHVGIVRVFVLGPKAVAKGGCAAARGQEGCWRVENRVPDTEAACLDGGLCSVMRQFFEREVCIRRAQKGGGCLEASCGRDLQRRGGPR